tara:strand:+ start:98 stop:721 length:624 start_codon:yes stop_codon:yes gene_type:complete
MNRIFTLILFTSYFASAQVGIGTLNPEADLHVAGDMLVQKEFDLTSLPVVDDQEENFKLLSRLTNSTPVGEITILDVNNLTVAPINVVDYKFRNVHLDNLKDVNLQYDADKYVVGLANFRQIGDAVKKAAVNNTVSIGTFVMRTFVSGNTWHLEIQNRDLDLDEADSLEYEVTLIVYDKSYFKNMPPIVTDLGGSNRGTASSIPAFN